jgi:hypothetical protein
MTPAAGVPGLDHYLSLCIVAGIAQQQRDRATTQVQAVGKEAAHGAGTEHVPVCVVHSGLAPYGFVNCSRTITMCPWKIP